MSTKPSYKSGQIVIYAKRGHDLKYLYDVTAKVICDYGRRVVIRDLSGRKHFVKPSNLSAAKTADLSILKGR